MPNIAEVIIAKQRNGPIGTVNLVWRPEFTKFANMIEAMSRIEKEVWPARKNKLAP